MYIDRWIDKEDAVCFMCVCVYIYIYNAICSIMDEPRDYNIKWSKSERQRQVSYDIT